MGLGVLTLCPSPPPFPPSPPPHPLPQACIKKIDPEDIEIDIDAIDPSEFLFLPPIWIAFPPPPTLSPQHTPSTPLTRSNFLDRGCIH